MAHALRVGGDIDAQCTKCKMVLGHTILAMVGNKPARVRCNTCDGEHNYRGTQANPPKKGTWQPKAVERAKPVVTSWEALIAAKDASRARRYSARELFATDELLEHPTFGLGLVQLVRGDKIQVAFKADVKTLVHGKA
ncbi:MAG: hypothetical protein NVS2B9_15180 [Myxococcales bacterium]